MVSTPEKPASGMRALKTWKSRLNGLRLSLADRQRRRDIERINTLHGRTFSQEANAHVQRFYKQPKRFGYDSKAQRFVASHEPRYRFSRPQRMPYYIHGLEHRGRQLSHEYLLHLIPFEDGDHIVESGGNDGDFMLALREQRKRLSLTSFEPSAQEFATLSLNMREMPFLDTAEAHNLALWKTTGETLSFYIKSDTADSSLHEIEGASEVVDVRTIRLDEALPSKRYKLLKLEAEGAEPEILEGATKILNCFDYITADVGFERGVKQESTLPQVSNFLLRNGFSMRAFGTPRHILLFANDTTTAASWPK